MPYLRTVVAIFNLFISSGSLAGPEHAISAKLEGSLRVVWMKKLGILCNG